MNRFTWEARLVQSKTLFVKSVCVSSTRQGILASTTQSTRGKVHYYLLKYGRHSTIN